MGLSTVSGEPGAGVSGVWFGAEGGAGTPTRVLNPAAGGGVALGGLLNVIGAGALVVAAFAPVEALLDVDAGND